MRSIDPNYGLVSDYKTTSETFLILKIGAIGDVVMALPLVEAIRRRFSSAHITWVCGKAAAPLVRATEKVDQIIEVDEKAILQSSLTEVARTLWRIGIGRFDHVVRAHRDWRYGFLVWGRGKRWIPTPGRYHGFEYLKLVGENELVWPKLKLPQMALQVDLVLAPGGNVKEERGKGLRMWPIENYVKLATELIRKNKRVAIVGGREDLWVKGHFDGAIDCVGKLSLLETLALMQQSRVVISHDSGPLHLGVLSGARVIGLFGPTMPMEKVPPQVETVWGGENLSCRPCYDGKNYAPCKKPLCMQSISVDSILNILDKQ